MQKKLISLTGQNVKLLGRTYMLEDTLWCAFSGTGADFNYTGSKLAVTIEADDAFCDAENQVRVAIYVDNKRVIDKMLSSSKQTFLLYEGDRKTIHVKIVKLSETAMSTMGIHAIEIADDETITPALEKKHKLEFIGDSITCGYGVDDEDENHSFHTSTEDVTRAYAYKTAQALDADYSMVSISGYGIISGYTDDPDFKFDAQTLPPYYDTLGFSRNKFKNTILPEEIKWDFKAFQPDAVVLNLGTNDDSYCKTPDRCEEFSSAYKDFLRQIREKNPDAHIFCAYGIMNNTMMPAIQKALQCYSKESGDNRVSLIELPTQDGSLGYVADFHPTEATHEMAAKIVTAEIKQVMGW